MLDPIKRHEVQVLKKAGIADRQIARLAGVSRRSVQRIAVEAPITRAPAESPPNEPRVGRPSVVAKWVGMAQAILAEKHDTPTFEVLRRLRLAGYEGGKSAAYDLVAKLRPKVEAPMVRFEGVAGEFSQHDFGHVHVEYVSGTSEMIHFFASRLKYSRFSHVETVPSERVEPLVRALLRSFEAFGGVPLVCVFDNPKTIVLRHEGTSIEWNPTFAQVAIDLRFAVELCTPHFANQKGAVENLVKWVKNSFFKARRFQDREDLERQLAEWLREINTVRPSRATGVPPAVRMEEERARLREIAYTANEYPLRIPITVGPTAIVDYDGVRYSMPPKTIGMPGTLFLYPNRVTITARVFQVEHPRYPAVGNTSFIPEHRAEFLAAVSGDRGRLYLKRQYLFDLGRVAVDLLTEVIHARPMTWKGDVDLLYDLLVAHGEARTLAAIEVAWGRRLFGAEYARDIIQERA